MKAQNYRHVSYLLVFTKVKEYFNIQLPTWKIEWLWLKMLSKNNLIKILSFEIFLFSCGKGENFLEISLPNDYNKFKPPVSPNENDQDFGPLKVEVLFQSIMINEIDQEHQTIIANMDIWSSWVESRLIVSGNTSGFDHKV